MPAGFLEQPFKVAKEQLLTCFEKRYLDRLLRKHGSNISRLAQDAELDRHMVRILLRKHGRPSGEGSRGAAKAGEGEKP
jgi:two-component system, NtrC family, response regulator GlrR